MNFCVSKNLLPQLEPQLHTEKSLNVWLEGKLFRNPVGVAAGIDTTGESAAGFLNLGFGFCEIGSCANGVSFSEGALQMANSRPQWTSAKNASNIPAVQAMLASNMERIKRVRNGKIGVSIGLSEETMESVPYLAEKDYVAGVGEFSDCVDYVVINLTAPRSYVGIDQFKNYDVLEDLLMKLKDKRERELGIAAVCEQELTDSPSDPNALLISRIYTKPKTLSHVPSLLFLKVPSPADKAQAANLGALAEKYGIDGVIVVAQPDGKGTEMLKELYRVTSGRVPLISVGGILDGREAYRRMKAGASLVQVCSGILTEGPYIGIKILNELHDEMKKEQYSSIQEVIGVDCNEHSPNS